MIERVHEHIISELQQNTRTDIVFILSALFINLMTLGVNSIIASESSDSSDRDIIMLMLVSLLVVINVVVIIGLLRGKQTRMKLINGLIKMYKDNNVSGYYDPSLLSNYNLRYNLFILTVVFSGFIAVSIPYVIR